MTWHIVEITYDDYGMSPAPVTEIYGPFRSLSSAVEFKMSLDLPEQANDNASVSVAVRVISKPSVRRVRYNTKAWLKG